MGLFDSFQFDPQGYNPIGGLLQHLQDWQWQQRGQGFPALNGGVGDALKPPVIAAPPADNEPQRGSPLSLSPPPMAAPQTSPFANMFNGISNGIAANPMTLMALGSGIMQGGFGKGLQLAMTGSALDQKNRQTTQAQNATIAALKAKGLSDAEIALAASNPDALKYTLDKIYGEKKPSGTVKIGNVEMPYMLNSDGTIKMLTPNGGQSFNDFVSSGQKIEAQGKALNAAAETEAKIQGENKAQLPNTLAKADETLSLIDSIKNHPSKKYNTGFGASVPAIPGQGGVEFNAMVDQLKGRSFLDAFTALKGSGQISNVEGEKATQAIARLERKQSPEAFDRALNDLADVIRKGRERAGILAGQNATPSPVKQNDPLGLR